MRRVLIVGGGLVGLACAEELARAGVETELLERNPEVGLEASGAAAGILCPQSDVQGPGPMLELLLNGFQIVPEAVARLEALTGASVGYRASGMISMALTDADEKLLEEQLRWQREAGLAVERLSAEEIRRLEPAVDGPVRWGLSWPRAAQVDPNRLVEVYRQAVLKQGGRIRTSVSATRLRLRGSRVEGLETSAGPLSAEAVINCAGPWAGFDADAPVLVPSVPVRGQIVQLRTGKGMLQRVVESPRAYLVQRSAEVLIAGTTVEHVGFDKGVTEEGVRSIRAGVREFCSRTEALASDRCWAGLRPDTPDHLPILGATPIEGLFLAAGHFRSGVLLAPLTGRLAADWILGRRSAVDLKPFQISRFMAKAAAL